MAANDGVDDILAQFVQSRPIYESYTSVLKRLLETLFEVNGTEYLQIESRTKTIESLVGKLNRPEKEGKYKSLGDITDLSGLRIVTFYERDVENICRVLEQNFNIDNENSVDKRKTMESDRFGYLSVHYVLGLSDIRNKLPENANFVHLKAEVQVRTVLQHAWAVLDRKLRYNTKSAIPKEIKRKLFLVSAKLEDADSNLTDIDLKVAELRKLYSDELKQGDPSSDINKDSLEVFVQQSKELERIWEQADNAKIASNIELSSDQATKTLGNLIDLLNLIGITNVRQLSQFISEIAGKAPKIFSEFASEAAKRGLVKKYTKYGIVRLLLCFSDNDAVADAALKNTPYVNNTREIISETIKRVRK
ncbi:GTP pyrophosphokinase [Mesorhizobium dulcispinae]|uniref:GTP pyrophosphokinase n=1 Tax=Mesorhizobium dulcispinae TaxID=3072316 RepID=UPI002A2421B8|nr:hypothetical protein [Mesorhizobium sp. VK23D]MDX8517202.1 hypothetical protein [Mesorhizobium sp. VK23D]